jgi:hypothetical protein
MCLCWWDPTDRLRCEGSLTCCTYRRDAPPTDAPTIVVVYLDVLLVLVLFETIPDVVLHKNLFARKLDIAAVAEPMGILSWTCGYTGSAPSYCIPNIPTSVGLQG